MNREDLLYAIKEEASYQKLIDVLLAVVELHEPYGDIMCVVCEGISYPCSTIQVIEKALE